MTRDELKETLSKQLQLLAQRSEGARGNELAMYSEAMVHIAVLLESLGRFG